MLILVGAGIIIYEATRRLVVGSEVEHLGVGIAVIGTLGGRQLRRLRLPRRRARALESPALEGDAAHLRTDALTSVGVLVGLLLVEITATPSSTRSRRSWSPGAIVVAGLRILTRLGPGPGRRGAAAGRARPDRGRDRGRARRRRRSSATTSSAPGAPARRRYIDLHLQFRSGTTLERRARGRPRLRDAIEAEIPDSEVLIHIEPEESFRPPEASEGPVPGGLSARSRSRLTAAAAPTAPSTIG